MSSTAVRDVEGPGPILRVLQGQSPRPEVDDDHLLRVYADMVAIRLADAQGAALAEAGDIPFHAAARHQEAALVGAAGELAADDWLFPGARHALVALARGMSLRRYFDHLFGNGSDPARGRRLPDQLTWRAGRVVSVGAPLGSHLGHAAGVAWAAKIDKSSQVALGLMGPEDFVSNDFHNALNFAGVSGAPLVVLCIDAGRERGAIAGLPEVAEAGVAYGVVSQRCDGGDLLAVIASLRAALERARAGQGPTLIHAPIAATDGDPVARLRADLQGQGLWDDAREEELLERIAREIEESVRLARAASPPPLGSLFEDVYAEEPWHLREQRAELTSLGGRGRRG
ncbi:MAG: thiamine pyrophosphate-dependent enzyme [Polyangiaceae bacterium]